jgi:hypothetical protein
MNYLNIFILLIIAILPKIAFADNTYNDSGMPDLAKSIFSGKFVPAPPPPTTPNAAKATPSNPSPTNGMPANNNTPANNSGMPSMPPQPSFTPSQAYSTPPQIPTASPVAQNNHSKATVGAGAGQDTNFGPPPKPVLTDTQKNIVDDARKEDQEMEKAFDKAIGENFDTYIYPKEYYQQPFSKQNSHLPPVDFASYYAGLAFKYTKSDDYLNVRYFVKKYNFVDVTDENGNNLLMAAVTYNGIKTARMLLANQIFHINAQNKQNLRCPLHIAVINNNYEMTRLLLTMGASPNIKDASNMTPLDYSRLLDNSQINSLLIAYK